MLDHQTITEAARAMGVRAEELLALTPNNDPFYADMPGRRKAAEWFAELANDGAFGLTYHLRRAHYRMANAERPPIKPDGSVYRNTHNDWKLLLMASRDARYHELIRLDSIFDKRNPGMIVKPILPEELDAPSVYVAGGALYELDLPEELDVPELFLTGFEGQQRYLILVVTEKSGMNDVLVPLCRDYGIGLVNFDGDSSEIGCRDMVNLSFKSGRPLRVLYLSDFDPQGRGMPVATARKIEFWLRKHHPGLDVTVDPIALLPEQVRRYNLPSIPMKEGERRADKFRAQFGCDATELDALEALRPGELRKIVTAAILRHYDPTLSGRVEEMRRAILGEIIEIEEEVAEQFAEQVEEAQEKYARLTKLAEELQADLRDLWAAYRDELTARSPLVRATEIPQPRDEDDHLSPLFDSKRDELTQLDWYRQWQRRARGT